MFVNHYLYPNQFLCMGKFSRIMLGIILTSLLAGSVQYVAADHTHDDNGIFKNKSEANTISTKDTKYDVHIQVVVRNIDGQLISISESKNSMHIPHTITDYILDNKVSKKEIVNINNIKYEKFQIIDTPTLEQRASGLYPVLSEIPIQINIQTEKTQPPNITRWVVHYCADFTELGHSFTCIPLFQSLTPSISLTEGDVVVNQWTILRPMG